MNNRFKFRVWDKRKNTYIKDFVFNFINKPPYITVEYFDNEYEYTHTFEEDEIIIEQCTGLKDKNNKLIYEGDIIKKEFKNKPFSSKAKIKEKLIKLKWNDVGACFSFDFLYEKDKHDDFKCWENSWSRKYLNDEVIGNIHENPDLLGEE